MNEVILCCANANIRVNLRSDGTLSLEKPGDSPWATIPVVHQEEGSIDVGAVWLRNERSICEQFPGRFRARAVSPSMARIEVTDDLEVERGSFTISMDLDADWLVLRIEDIDERLPSLAWPSALPGEALILPLQQGRMVTQPEPKRWLWTFSGGSLNMRCFGGISGNRGWLCVISEGHADALLSHHQMQAAPVWIRSMGEWKGTREIRLCLCGGGYVGLAKRFREWAKSRGLWKSLEEKISVRPEIGNLIGGGNLSLLLAQTRSDARRENLLLAANGANGLEVLINYRQAEAMVADALFVPIVSGFTILAIVTL